MLTTIDQVVAKLDQIVADSLRTSDRRGYFAALYRRVTLAVKAGIASGRFANGARMERLDVTFACRYFDAYDRRQSNEPTTASWRTAFDAASSSKFIVLQQLLVGMNAHINLDLGIAAAETCPGDEILQLEGDFRVINEILSEQLDGVQAQIDKISPWIGLLDRIGGRTDEMIANFGIRAARELAWETAQRLAPLDAAERAPLIETLDEIVATLGQAILRPGFFLSTALWLIRLRESSDVPRNISLLMS